MRKTIIRWSACAAVLLPALGASSALADSTPGVQGVGQIAGNQQTATSTATSTQDHPSNQNIAVAIMSPGAGAGNVTQSNSSSATSAAGNQNGTSQAATQNGAGGGAQEALQAAGSSQSASSSATSTQDHPSNQNIQVAILSPGAGSGNVRQSNDSSADSKAGNQNGTSQDATQNAAGGGGGGVQAIGQAALNRQSADSTATSTQDHPSNKNVDVTILGHKVGGGCCDRSAPAPKKAVAPSVSQSNSSSADSKAGNQNGTSQTATQDAGGGKMLDRCETSCGDCKSSCDGHDGSGVQAIGQLAASKQDASSEATSKQDHPSNTNIPVAIFSPGANRGSVTQSNDSSADSKAGNVNGTSQTATQNAVGGGGCKSPCGGHDGSGVQAIGQAALSYQSADSEATSKQDHPSNTNIPVAIFSPGANGGSVTQSNSSSASSMAGNQNGTSQTATQNAAGGGGGVQAIGQLALNKQKAESEATSKQFGASNLNVPVAIGYGKDGHGKDQCEKRCPDDYGKDGYAKDDGYGKDGYGKDDHGKDDGYGKDGYGKDAGWGDRPAPSLEKAVAPSVSQSNSSSADSMAGNENGTMQTATQNAFGGRSKPYDRCEKSCDGHGSSPGVQAIGQAAFNWQSATSDATSDQWCPTNVSFGTPGDLTQSNDSSADSKAGNKNGTSQTATQNSGWLFPWLR